MSNFPDSLLVWRSMTHWTGGIGVIMLFITIMPQVGSGANYLFNAEIPGPAAERTLPKIKESAFVIFTVYIFFTIITTVALKVAGMSWFMAMNLALASVATGGFSYQYESLMEFETVYVEMIVIIAMVAASLNFALYYKIYQHNFKVFWIDTERKAYFWIIGIATFLITWNLYYTGYFDAATSFRHALFQTVSIASTTGFASSDFNLWPDFSRYVLLLFNVCRRLLRFYCRWYESFPLCDFAEGNMGRIAQDDPSTTGLQYKNGWTQCSACGCRQCYKIFLFVYDSFFDIDTADFVDWTFDA